MTDGSGNMEVKEMYDDLAVLEVEIISLTDEGFKVKYDFRRKILSWRDNYMWNNNFTSLINDGKFDLLKEKLPKIGVLEWIKAYSEGDAEKFGRKASVSGMWKMKAEFKDKTVIATGSEEIFPAKWDDLRSLIEMTTGTKFALR